MCSCFLHTFSECEEFCTRDATPPPFFFSSPLLLTDLPLGLVLIRQKALVGHLPGNHKVYKITKIAVIPLSDEEPQELELEVCTHALFILLFNFCFNHAFSSLGSTSNS